MKLTKHELNFIFLSTVLLDGVFDFQSYEPEEFKRIYGLTQDEAVKMVALLQEKAKKELLKYKNH